MKHKLYIFDMGGVVVQNFNVFPRVYQTLNLSEDRFTKHSGNNFELLLEGKISAKQFWDSFSQNYGIPVGQDLFKEFFHPTVDPQVIKLITQLKQTARVVCGTNVIDSHYDYLIQTKNYDIFDRVYASNKMGIAKPNQDFYRYILNHEQAEANESCFVDDTAENVEAAASLGLTTVHFTGVQSLKAIF